MKIFFKHSDRYYDSRKAVELLEASRLCEKRGKARHAVLRVRQRPPIVIVVGHMTAETPNVELKSSHESVRRTPQNGWDSDVV